MASVNKVILVGNLGKDPEIRATQGGQSIANFSVATSDTWKDKNSGERKERTEWHRVVVFNEKLAEIVQKYLRKGSKVYLEGQLATRKWEKDGVERYSTEVVLPRFGGVIVMLSGNERTGAQGEPAAEPQGRPASRGSSARDLDLDSDIPF